ncbi:hypothetical protein PUN28_001723 [Cardiocondyla obscurior]|uniref:Secreted protein n=1 Tax=Cardiocondyla obscurior TaxID=286306 RepID=A0AAW2GQV5_9HYME
MIPMTVPLVFLCGNLIHHAIITTKLRFLCSSLISSVEIVKPKSYPVFREYYNISFSIHDQTNAQYSHALTLLLLYSERHRGI